MKDFLAGFKYALVVFVFVLVTILHALLLLNPFWFRDRALGWFGNHCYFKYFSVLSLWFVH